jgi:hypothetical protein
MGTKTITPPAANDGGSAPARAPAPAVVPQVRQPKCDPKRLFDDVTKILQNISRTRGRPLFALISDYINSEAFEEIYSWKRALRDAPNFDVLIYSPGGQLTACYLVARLLSRVTNEWEALIPEKAWSGATLICLGSSNLVMAECGQLGPLDPQVASKKREKFFATERQSPLEAFEAVKYLREFVVSTVDALMEQLTNRGVAPQKALETAGKLATELARPVLEKIEPYDLGAFALDSKLAVTYCKDVARPSEPRKKTQRRALYRSLVEDYPAHEYSIDFGEAQVLKFNVSEPTLEIDNLFDELRPQISGLDTYIGLVPPDEVRLL